MSLAFCLRSTLNSTSYLCGHALSALPALVRAVCSGAPQSQPDASSSSGSYKTSTFVREAFSALHYPASLEKLIINPDRIMTVMLPVAMDTGEVNVYSAHRVQHNNARGPFKGGLIYDPDITLDEVSSLASVNTWKSAMMNVPFGGAKGGVTCDPANMSEREKEVLTRVLVENIKEIIGPFEDIPAPDLGTDENVMAWMFDEYCKFQGFSPAVVTGKPVWLHGTQGRDTAPARGVSFVVRELLKKMEGGRARPSDKTYAVQGFGKLGSWTAQYLHDMGGKVVAVGDRWGGVYSPQGLDITAVRQHAAAGKPLQEFPEGEPLEDREKIVGVPCDMYIPAAVSGVIHAGNAAQLQCQYLVEAGNASCTPEADGILRERGIPVVPDLCANGGGVVVSFFEWVQNVQNFKWEADEVTRRLDRYMTDSFAAMWKVAHERDVPLRTAAYLVALQRVADAELSSGFL